LNPASVITYSQPVGLLIVLVIGKILLDIKLHLREHKKAKAPEPKPAQ